MTRFGPAGNCDRFYEENHKATLEAPAWLAAQGLDAFEYSAGRGVSLSEKTARAIGQQARLHGVALSIHAPYYINCAAADRKSGKNPFNTCWTPPGPAAGWAGNGWCSTWARR